MSSATGGLRLLSRHLRSGMGPSVLIAVVVTVCAFLALAVPLTLTRLADAELRSRLADLSDPLRSLSGSTRFPFTRERVVDADQAWQPLTEPVQSARDRLPRPLRDAAGVPLLEVRTPRDAVVDPTGSPQPLRMSLAADPDVFSRVRWVDGAAPELWSGTSADPNPRFDPSTGEVTPGVEPETQPPIPIGLSARAAERMGLAVGDTLTRTGAPPLVVAGLFEPRDPDALAWRLHPGLLRAGNDPTAQGDLRLAAVALVAPASPGTDGLLSEGVVSAIIPIRADAWTSSDAPRVAAQLEATIARGIELPGGDGLGGTYILLTTQSTQALRDGIAQSTALSILVTLASAGPAGTALLVLALGIGAVLERRRPAIAVATARGASPLALRGAAALDGALVGIPAAGVGAAVAVLAVPTRVAPGAVLVAAILGLAPAVIGFARGGPRPVREERDDLGSRRGRGWRTVVEAAVVVLAAAVTVTLLLRGPGQDAATIDPLLVIAPLLLALGVGVVVLRIYPLALRAAQSALRRGRRAPGFLGVARGVREPTLGLAAALAILTGVSVGTLSATLLTTVDSGTRQAARADIGADIRADISIADPGGPVRRIPGMRDLADIAPQRAISYQAESVDVVSASTDALHRIRSDVPSGMARTRDGAIPILVSSDLDERIGDHVRLARQDAVVVGRLPTDAGLGTIRHWVLVDRGFVDRLVDRPTLPTLLLADVAPGASAREVATRLRTALPDEAVVTDAQSRYDALRAVPAVGGLSSALVGASAIAAGLATLAAVLSVVAATRRRDRTTALLRVLGLSRAQGRRMTVAELVPAALVLVAAGAALGIGLAALVTAVIDLAPFTGGSGTALDVAPGPVALVAGGFLVLAAVATTAAARLSSRVTPADVIRTGE